MTELETCVENLLKWQATRRWVYANAIRRVQKNPEYLEIAMRDIRQAPPKTLVDAIERLLAEKEKKA